MELLILGSGTSVPHAPRSSSAYWVATGKGTLLLDCSASSVHRMAQEGCDWAGLDAIWISHFHLDHVGGLAPFLFGTKHAPQTQQRQKPLRIFGPPGIRKLLDTFDSAYDYGLLDQPFPLDVIEAAAGTFFEPLPGLSASLFSTPHTPESHAIRLEASTGETLAYTADSGYSTNLAVFARNVDLLLVECSFVRNKPVKTHMELDDIAQLAKFAKAKKIVLTHLYPEWDGQEAEAANTLTESNVVVAHDGLRIEIVSNRAKKIA